MERRTPGGPRRWREQGQGSLEYLGVVIVGVMVLLGLVLVPAAEPIRNTMSQAVCAVTTKGPEGSAACEAGGALEEHIDPYDFEPDSCTSATSGTNHKGEVSIAFIDLGGAHGVKVAEVQNADGSTHYLVTHEGEGEGGVGVGIGGKGKGGEDSPGVEASGDLGISGSYTQGTTYKVDSLEAAQALADDLMGNPFSNHGHEPLTETVTWGGEFEGSLDLGLGTGGADTGGPADGSGSGEDGEGGDELGAGASLTGGHSYATTTNYETGETTYLTTWSGELSGNADAFEGLNVSGTWKGTTAIAVVRDENGQISSVRFITTEQAGSTLKVGGKPVSASGKEGVDVTTTVTLNVNDANRGVVETWLGNSDATYMGVTPLQTLFWDPTQASSDPMQNLLFNQAQITQVSMANSNESYEIGGEVKWGLKLGASYTRTDSEGEVVDAQYAGPPSAGRRPWTNLDVCFQ